MPTDLAAVSAPNIMNPVGKLGVPGNSDIIIHSIDSAGNRSFASSVDIFNDRDTKL